MTQHPWLRRGAVLVLFLLAALPAWVAASPSRPPSSALPADEVAGSAPEAARSALPVRALTTGGCCTQPFWSADGRQVMFVDKPAAGAPVGIWGVDVTRPGSAPALVTDRVAYYTPDMAFAVDTRGGRTVVERRADGAKWTIAGAAGNTVSFSPNRTRIAWQVSNQNAAFDRRTSQVWIANVDGTAARNVATLPRGNFAGWVGNDVVLLRERPNANVPEDRLFTLSLVTGATTEVLRTQRIQGTSLSPDGQWLAYHVALHDTATQNGLWVVRTDGTARRQLDRSLFGSYRWRDGSRLLIVPMRADAAPQVLWQWNAATRTATQLSDAATPLKIANSDWAVSPDGRYLVYLAAGDGNLWLAELP